MACSKTKLLVNETKDGNSYKQKADFEKQKLMDLAEMTERYLANNNGIPDESRGSLRSAAGKAKLLINGKFRQFEELIDNFLHPKAGRFAVEPQDLAGFWDLTMIEVQSVYKSFADFEIMANNC